MVVDEEIYRKLPSLLIATVDKFAQMPWKGEVQMLFGQVNGYCERHGDCHFGLYCNPHGRCVPQMKSGEQCTSHEMCP